MMKVTQMFLYFYRDYVTRKVVLHTFPNIRNPAGIQHSFSGPDFPYLLYCTVEVKIIPKKREEDSFV